MRERVRRFAETVQMQSGLIRRIRTHRWFPAGLLATIVVLVASFHVWQRVQVLSLLTEVDQLKHEHRELIDTATKLRADMAELSMGERIESYARDSLGLVRLSAENIYTLVDDDRPKPPTDGFTNLVKAIERVGKWMPGIKEDNVNADELKRIRFHEDEGEGGR
jgi:cell division protein FtsL